MSEIKNLTSFLCQVNQLFKSILNTERRGKSDNNKNVLLFWEINMIRLCRPLYLTLAIWLNLINNKPDVLCKINVYTILGTKIAMFHHVVDSIVRVMPTGSARMSEGTQPFVVFFFLKYLWHEPFFFLACSYWGTKDN